MSTARTQELAVFYEKLGQLEQAGVPILEGLPLATMQVTDPALRRDLQSVGTALTRGVPLGEAFRLHTRHIPPLHLALLCVGENQGQLDKILLNLSEICERDYKARKELSAQLLYPAFLLVSALLLPHASTWYTKGLWAYLKEVVADASSIALPVGAVLGGLYLLSRSPVAFDRFKLGLPVIGKLLSQLALARFCRSLAALISAGVELSAGLKLAVASMDNHYLEGRCPPALLALSRGEPLAQCLVASGAFPPELIQRVVIGERAGKLDPALAKAAEYYDFEAQRNLKTLLKMLPVLIFVLVAVLVAKQVISFYSGYFEAIDKATTGPF